MNTYVLSEVAYTQLYAVFLAVPPYETVTESDRYFCALTAYSAILQKIIFFGSLILFSSVAEPDPEQDLEPQGAENFGRSRYLRFWLRLPVELK